MSGFSTGIGLATGIDTATLIDQLMAIEARPIETLGARVQTIDIKRAAFMGISAQLLALQNSILGLNESSFFRRFSSPSSDDGILTATAGENAVPGTYTFRVHSLVTTHSVLSRGFADADTTPVGQGTLSIEIGNGGVNEATELDALRGGEGVRRGTIMITDRTGVTAEIDLSMAQTVEDVLTAINTDPTINVRAYVTSLASPDGAVGDRIVIEDLTPDADATGNLIIADKPGGSTAADLGIVASVAGNRVDGRDLVRMSSSTLLSSLNDGNGVGRFAQGAAVDDLIFTRNGDAEDSFSVSLSDILQPSTDLRALNSGQGVRLGTIRITDRLGESLEVNLADSGAPPVLTVQDVLDRIKAASDAAGMSIDAATVNSALLISDNSDVSEEAAGAFTIEDVAGFAAADLGIADSKEDPGAIIGRDIYRMTTIGDVINAINYTPGNNGLVQAAISEDGNGIALKSLAVASTFTVSSGAGSTAAEDLGILDAEFTQGLGPFESRSLLAGLNTVLLRSLNGGRGVELGRISINGTEIDFDTLPKPQTLQDVVDMINAAMNEDPNNPLVASINWAGTGIRLYDESGSVGQIIVNDVNGGSMAADLGIAGTFDGDEANGANLQRQYISRQTLLSDLNLGRGVNLGDFQITDSNGALHFVTLPSHLETVGKVIDAINSANPPDQALFEARINDTGDGIVVIDKAGGALPLTIEDIDDGQTAADLRLAGTAKAGEGFIDGSFEIRIDVGPGDTLNAVAAKLTEAGLQTSVLNDGGGVNPYSLTIASAQSGRRGAMVIDSRGVDLGFQTMSQAKDALITMGDETSSNPLLIASSSNTIDGLIEGVTLDLVSAADEAVSISVSQDVDAIVDSIGTFVDNYNDVQAALDDATRFDPDTLERGPLQGDPTINLVRNRLHNVMLRQFEGTNEQVSRLMAVGVRLGANNRLEFDEEKFKEVYESSPELVERLFTTQKTGFGTVFEEILDELTRDSDGLIAGKDSLLSDQQEILNDQIDRLSVLLELKRARYEAQFAALESAIAALQAQQTSLGTLFQLAGQTSA
ncbi:MAG: flagellar filament capping protein FliD [Planctomycetota bacterium]|jgi:flagellar hook-associated protein 2